MSIELMTAVWKLELPHPQLLVALALADHGNDDGTSIYPSLGRIGWKCGYSDRQVRRIIRELEAAALLVKVADPSGDRGTEYRMDTSVGKAKPPFSPKRGADKMSGGQNVRADISGQGGGHSDPGGADIAVSAEPSVEPSGNQPSANAEGVAAAPPPDETVERLCNLMSSHVRSTHGIAASSKQATVTKGWRDACRAMLTIDEHSPEQIEYAIAWVCRHHYWRNRIKSVPRLRSEWPEFVKDIRAERERKQHLASTTNGLSPSAQAREQRTARRMARLNADQPQVGEPHGDLSDGREERRDRRAIGPPQPVGASGS